MSSRGTRLLGLDPGLRCTGWGVIDVEGNALAHVEHGVLTSSDKDPLSLRLKTLYTQLNEVIERFAPQEAAVEEIFVNANPRSALKLGLARGVILLAPACAGLLVEEYPATTVKKSVVGVGHADKHQVATMVGRLLPKSRGVTKDAADALAVAICHAHHRAFPAALRERS